MHSGGEVKVHRAAGRGQQMSEGRGGMLLLVRKKEMNNEMIYRGKTGVCLMCNPQEIFNLLKPDTKEMI